MQLRMDIYEPAGDTATNRPLLIFCHQGGFYSGTKTDSDMVVFCTQFAKMGYVTASIEYRLTDIGNLLDSVNMIKSVFRGLQDGKAAIRYFRQDVAVGGNTYSINPNGIFFGGASAGSILSTHLVYMNDTLEMPPLWRQYLASIGGLEGTSGNPGYSTDVVAVYNFAGTLADTNWLQAGDPPLFSSHTVDDPLAIYGYGPPYGSALLPNMYGSSLLHQRAVNIGMESTFYSYAGSQHPPYKNAPLFDTAIVHLRDFLYQYVPCNTISIGEFSSENSFSIYPNPSQGHITITRKQAKNEVYNLRILNGIGQEIWLKKNFHQSTTLDLSSFPKGVYLIQIRNIRGSLIATEQIALE